MRAVLSFFSMLALGLMIAAMVMIGVTGGAGTSPRPGLSAPYLDYMSVVIGLGVGLVIAVLAQISWSELPQRLLQWLLINARRLRLLVLAAVCVAIIIYF
jgi:hypothetical protein